MSFRARITVAAALAVAIAVAAASVVAYVAVRSELRGEVDQALLQIHEELTRAALGPGSDEETDFEGDPEPR